MNYIYAERTSKDHNICESKMETECIKVHDTSSHHIIEHVIFNNVIHNEEPVHTERISNEHDNIVVLEARHLDALHL